MSSVLIFTSFWMLHVSRLEKLFPAIFTIRSSWLYGENLISRTLVRRSENNHEPDVQQDLCTNPTQFFNLGYGGHFMTRDEVCNRDSHKGNLKLEDWFERQLWSYNQTWAFFFPSQYAEQHASISVCLVSRDLSALLDCLWSTGGLLG